MAVTDVGLPLMSSISACLILHCYDMFIIGVNHRSGDQYQHNGTRRAARGSNGTFIGLFTLLLNTFNLKVEFFQGPLNFCNRSFNL